VIWKRSVELDTAQRLRGVPPGSSSTASGRTAASAEILPPSRGFWWNNPREKADMAAPEENSRKRIVERERGPKEPAPDGAGNRRLFFDYAAKWKTRTKS